MGKIEKETKSFIIIGIIALIIVLVLLSLHNCNSKNRQINLLNSVQDTLVITKNKDSSETAKTSLIVDNNTDLILQIKSKDEIIKLLQNEIIKNKNQIKNGGSITVVESATSMYDSASTIVKIINRDSCNPIYSASNKDTTWIKWKVIASRDFTNVDFISKDKYSVVIGSEKVGLFKRNSIVEITTYNPYNHIKSMKAFEVQDNRAERKISIGLQGGYGITLHGLSPYIGLGINFRLL